MLVGALECTILLVKVGADYQKKLNLPVNDRRKPPQHFDPLVLYRQLGLNGKTAQLMAQLSKKEDLIKVMAEFENKEKKFASTICRCGSITSQKEIIQNQVLEEFLRERANYYFAKQKSLDFWGWSDAPFDGASLDLRKDLLKEPRTT